MSDCSTQFTLLDICNAFRSKKEESWSKKRSSDMIAGLTELATLNPVLAVNNALNVYRYIVGHHLMEAVIVPYAEIFSDDIGMLRKVTACIVAKACAKFQSSDELGDSPSDIRTMQTLATLLQTLINTPGQKKQARELASDFYDCCMESAEDDKEREFIAQILPYTKSGEKIVRLDAVRRLRPSV